MTAACVIAATCILIAGLFAVIVERTNERDEARTLAARLEAEPVRAGAYLYTVRKVPLLGQPLVYRCRVEVSA
jgi:hypothetical protein